MFAFPEDLLTYKHYRFENGRPLSPRAKVKKLEAEGYRNVLIEQPQIWRLFGKKKTTSFFSKSKGFVLPNVIKQKVALSNKEPGFCYIEVLGNDLLITIYGNDGLLMLDTYHSLNEGNVASAFLELKVVLDKPETIDLPIYCANGNGLVKQLITDFPDRVTDRYKDVLKSVDSRSLDLVDGLISFGGKTLDLHQSRKEAFIRLHRDSKDEEELESLVETLDTKVYEFRLNPIVSSLTLTETTEDSHNLSAKCLTKQISVVRKRNTQTKMVYGFAAASTIGGYQFTSYTLQQQKIAEQEALRASQVRVESPWREVREDLTNPQRNNQAEHGLTSVYNMLRAFEKANDNYMGSSLGWNVAEFTMNGSLMTIYPTSTGGTNEQLARFSERMKLRQRTGKKGAQIDALFLPKAIDSSAYLTDANGETNYLVDAYTFLFDDLQISTTNQAVNGNGIGQYRIHLVKVDFKCWLPIDFLFASTQLANRNFALHSIEAVNSEFKRVEDKNPLIEEEFIEVEASSECDFGYTGSINFKIFGSK